jgi:hypothetical protein
MAKLHGTVIGICPNCDEPIGDQHPVSWCEGCGELVPDGIKIRISSLVNPDTPKVTQTSSGTINKGVTGQYATEPHVVSSLMKRYKDAYAVARVTNGFGVMIKVVGMIIGGLLALAGFIVASDARPKDPMSVLGIVGIVFGIIVGALFFIIGVLVCAQGQILKASLDSAVNNSPFLTNQHRTKIMSLPEV